MSKQSGYIYNVKEVKMKKASIRFLVTGLLLASGVKAQTIQEGVNHLNSGRVKTAISVFEKMRAINPNNAEATYWLGQSYLDLDEIAGARIKSTRELYEKALQSTTTTPSPILLVGMGHVELLENKTSEARQRFETALTMTRTKKGDDQNILIAVGRANVDAKSGDYKYAIEKLLAATDKGEKSAEAFLQLGNAYRKAGQGSGGGDAFVDRGDLAACSSDSAGCGSVVGIFGHPRRCGCSRRWRARRDRRRTRHALGRAGHGFDSGSRSPVRDDRLRRKANGDDHGNTR